MYDDSLCDSHHSRTLLSGLVISNLSFLLHTQNNYRKRIIAKCNGCHTWYCPRTGGLICVLGISIFRGIFKRITSTQSMLFDNRPFNRKDKGSDDNWNYSVNFKCGTLLRRHTGIKFSTWMFGFEMSCMSQLQQSSSLAKDPAF